MATSNTHTQGFNAKRTCSRFRFLLRIGLRKHQLLDHVQRAIQANWASIPMPRAQIFAYYPSIRQRSRFADENIAIPV